MLLDIIAIMVVMMMTIIIILVGGLLICRLVIRLTHLASGVPSHSLVPTRAYVRARTHTHTHARAHALTHTRVRNARADYSARTRAHPIISPSRHTMANRPQCVLRTTSANKVYQE